VDEDLAARAARLRRSGLGVKRIARELGISAHRAMVLVRDVPLPASVPRPRARDGVRAAALLLRAEGRTYDEIHDELSVSKGTLSLWLRDEPSPTPAQRDAVLSGEGERPCVSPGTDREVARALRAEGWLLREVAAELGVAPTTAHQWTRGVPVPARAVHGRDPAAVRAMGRAYWDGELAVREVERRAVMDAAAAGVGALSARELELVAVTAYWCEGSKSKPWRRSEFLTFINSDPDLIRAVLVWLRQAGVPPEDLYLSLSIHESADVASATQFWAGVVGVPAESFAKAALKRHNPKTLRKNTGEAYRGCLVVGVRRSRLLYQRMAGTWQGVAAATAALAAPPDAAD
jgi:transcriptional regulator with XRE-family HTH domain